MKKVLSFILSTAILLNMAPAFAAEKPLSDSLSDVTTKVKGQISISDQFTEFNGNIQDNGFNEYWHLTWQKDNESDLSIDATTEGEIMQYSLSTRNTGYNYESNFAPSFPKLSREDAKGIADNFLKKVINGTGESYTFAEDNFYYHTRNISSYDFMGKIKLNGVFSQIGFTIRVNIESKAVNYFMRDDLNAKYIGTLPSSKPEISKEEAAKLLNSKTKLKLEYVVDYSNYIHSKTTLKKAVLRYIPEEPGNYIVDAHTGKAIDLNEIFKQLETDPLKNERTADAASPSLKMENKLTKTELEGIDKIKDVLSKEKLDSTARAYSEFGLNGFTLNNVNYYINYNNEYFCSLDYSKIEPKEHVVYKYITINAKTGEITSLYTSYSYEADDKKNKTAAKLGKTETLKKAEEFLSKYYKDKYSKTKLYNSNNKFAIYDYEDITDQFIFAQQENGYFFPDNAYNVAVNNQTGTIDSFASNFIDVAFDSADGIVPMETALGAYNGAFTTKLSYINFPKKLDLSVPEFQPYIKRGYQYLYEHKLAYTKEADIWPYGVDAKTGKVLNYENNKKDELTYSDVKKSDKEILALAKFGIGFSSDKFEKSKKLTQRDMLAFLVSANDGYIYKQEQIDDLYQTAYNLGILKKSERNDNKNITRAELVKTTISMSGYGKTAELKGIYVCTFKDSKDIPSQYYGYVATAQGLGIIKGGANINFAPNAVATREQAAIVLYNFMSR